MPRRSRKKEGGRRSRDDAPASTSRTESNEQGPTETPRRTRRRRRNRNRNRDRSSEPGCFHDCLRQGVKLIHVTDALLGLFMMGYGFAISANTEPPKAAVSILTVLGALLVASSVLGLIGFLSPWCGRCGLFVSAWCAPVVAAAELTGVLAVIANHEAFFEYLETNHDKLYMDEDAVKKIESVISVFYIIFTAFAVIELCRFFILRRVRKNLVQHDTVLREEARLARETEREERRQRRERERQERRGGGSRGGSSKNSEEAGSLTEPLVGQARNRNTTDNIILSWFRRITGNDGRTGGASNPLETDTTALGTTAETASIEGSSGDEFAPLDDDLHVDTLYWSRGASSYRMNMHGESSSEGGELGSVPDNNPPWFDEDPNSRGDGTGSAPKLDFV